MSSEAAAGQSSLDPEAGTDGDPDRESEAVKTSASERAPSEESDTTAIAKGSFGDLEILTLSRDDLLSLGINPDHVDQIRYRTYNGAVLIEPVDC